MSEHPVTVVRDVYAAGRDQIITHIHGEKPGVAGSVSISPRRTEFPVRGRELAVASLLGAAPGSVTVLCAAGGWGKTTVAAAAAEQADALGMHVWWVSAADVPRLSTGMRALAVRLGAPPDRLRLAWSGQDGDAADLVWELLGEHSHPWLLVIDSADDVRILAGLDGRISDETGWIRRPPPPGRLIVVSRNHNPIAWGNWVQLRSLGDLSAEHAVEVLYDRAGRQSGSPEEAAALADRLGRMPLLLHQAGLYLAHANRSAQWPEIRPSPRTFEQYRAELDDRFGALVDAPVNPYRESQRRERVITTWDLSLDLLADHGIPQARPLLQLLACFADAPVPYPLVLSPSALAASTLYTLTTEQVEQGIDGLADFGLLRKEMPQAADGEPADYTVLVHPLIAETVRNHPDTRGHRHMYLTAAARGLSDAVRTRDIHNPAHSPFWQLVASHLHQLCAHAVAGGEDVPIPAAEALVEVAAACIEYAADAGVHAQAETAAREIAPLAELLPAEQPAVLRLRYRRSRLAARDYRGDPGVREAECRTVLEIQRRALGDRHPDTLETWNGLAWVMAERGDLERAEAEYRIVLRYRREVLGEDHRDTLDTWHNLAATLGRQEDWASAETEYRALLSIQRLSLGEDYLNTLWTRNGLAWVLSERGDLASAESEHRAVLAVQRRTIGALHPDTLWTRHNIARLLARRGELQAAEEECRSVLSDRVKVLGETHPHALHAWRDLAGVLGSRGELAAAEDEYRIVLGIQQRTLGEEHPDTLITRYDLAGVLGQRGNLEEAEAEYRSILALRTRVFGTDHPDTTRTLEALHATGTRRRQAHN